MQFFLSCDISNKALVRRLIINKIFGILTLGIYRFWGKTHFRRLLWQSIRIGNDRLTYHGTAKELFLGFLIAIVILAVLFGIVGILLQILVISIPVMAFVAQLMNMVLLFGFWQFARYRLWRYRLSRTSYRTVRFYQMGSALTYTGLYLWWGLLSVLSLGWAFPKLKAVTANYRINNMAFGDQSFDYHGRSSDFYKIYWPVVAYSGIVGLVAAFAFYMSNDFKAMFEMTADGKIANPQAFLSLMGGYLGVLLVGGVLYAVARVREFNYVIGKTRFSGAGFAANLSVKSVFKIGLGVFLVNAVFLGAIGFGIWAVGQNPLLAIIIIVLFLVYFLAVNLVMYIFFYIPMLKLVCASIATDRVEVFSDVAASSHDAPAYGEGFADALDVGAF